jgi:hypothetical protein
MLELERIVDIMTVDTAFGHPVEIQLAKPAKRDGGFFLLRAFHNR